MSPEELQIMHDIKNLLYELNAKFERFTNEKKQHWKDEQARRRERGY